VCGFGAPWKKENPTHTHTTCPVRCTIGILGYHLFVHRVGGGACLLMYVMDVPPRLGSPNRTAGLLGRFSGALFTLQRLIAFTLSLGQPACCCGVPMRWVNKTTARHLPSLLSMYDNSQWAHCLLRQERNKVVIPLSPNISFFSLLRIDTSFCWSALRSSPLATPCHRPFFFRVPSGLANGLVVGRVWEHKEQKEIKDRI